MELTITAQETLQIEDLFSPLENIIMKIILVGADSLEKADLKALTDFLEKIEKLNLKYLTEKTNGLLDLIKENKKEWSRLEREELALITSMLHQTIITIKSKFVKHNDFNRREKSDLLKPINIKQTDILELLPLEIQGIGRSSYGSGKYYGQIYKINGINLENNEYVSVIDHSLLQASSMNSKWYSSLVNETLYLNKLIGNKLTLYKLVSEGSTVYRKAPKHKKKGEVTELSAEMRMEMIEKFNQSNTNYNCSIKNIKKFIYDPKTDNPFKIQLDDEEKTVESISFNKNVFYYMYFNKKKDIQILKHGNTKILFDEGDAFLTDLPLTLPVTIWKWDMLIPLWLKNKEEFSFMYNLILVDVLKGKMKTLVEEKIENHHITKTAVKNNMLKFFVMNELNQIAQYPFLPKVNWKELIREYSSAEKLSSLKNLDSYLVSMIVFDSKKKKLLRKLKQQKISTWIPNYIENLIDKQESKNFSNYVLQRIRSNVDPKEIALLLTLHLNAFDFLTEDIIRTLKGSKALENSRKLQFYMDSTSEKRFWLSCIPVFTQIKRVETWDRVMIRWVMDSLSPSEKRHLACTNLVSDKLKKQLLKQSQTLELGERESISLFIQEQLLKIGVKYPWEIKPDWKVLSAPFKMVDTAPTSITDTTASLMIYKIGSSELVEKYEELKKLYWGFLLIKELVSSKDETEVNRLILRLISSSPRNTTFLWALLKDTYGKIPDIMLRSLIKSQSFSASRVIETYLNSNKTDRFYYSCLAVIKEKEMKKI